MHIGFLRTAGRLRGRARRAPGAVHRPGRTLGAFDGAAAWRRSAPSRSELTVVGGAAVPADAVTNVTVSPPTAAGACSPG